MLEKIIGDSLVFEKYYNQDKIYDCSSNKILKMNFHKKGEYVLSPLTFGLVGSALAFGYISLDLLFNYLVNSKNIYVRIYMQYNTFAPW